MRRQALLKRDATIDRICRCLRVPVLECGQQAGETYPGRVLDLSNIDLEEIANALADQTDYERHWLINPGHGRDRVLDS